MLPPAGLTPEVPDDGADVPVLEVPLAPLCDVEEPGVRVIVVFGPACAEATNMKDKTNPINRKTPENFGSRTLHTELRPRFQIQRKPPVCVLVSCSASQLS